ncbi:hypothetical protein GC722_14505 [Auraticoccus sp. F435]|uniref:Uncharacterized protein n=1 Tax=Auraticoccus cholistanensis TaxID=2656650 RepID=A0A6A9UWK4_9ACTN|nr:hypothetical protein [Auraticoccus cholistanensis]
MAGQLADGHRAAHVQRGLAAGLRQRAGTVGDGGVEVEGVGEVEPTGHRGQPVLATGHVVGDVEAAAVGGGQALPFGLGGHEPHGRGGDEPVELGGADPAGHGGDLVVDKPGRLDGEGRGAGGDPAGLPCRHLTAVDELPQPGEAVAQLERLPDQRAAGVGGAAQRGRQLGHAGLINLWCTGTRERNPGGAALPGGLGDVLDRRVQVGPRGRVRQDGGSGGVLRGTGGTDVRQQRCGVGAARAHTGNLRRGTDSSRSCVRICGQLGTCPVEADRPSLNRRRCRSPRWELGRSPRPSAAATRT